MTVSTQTNIVDTFDRVETDTWGTSSNGVLNWVLLSGEATYLSVDGSVGIVGGMAPDDGAYVHEINNRLRTWDLYWDVRVPSTVSGGETRAVAMFQGAKDGLEVIVQVRFLSDGSIDLRSVNRFTDSVNDAITVSTGETHNTGTTYRVRMQLDLYGLALRAKLWDSSASEPAGWDLTRDYSTLGRTFVDTYLVFGAFRFGSDSADTVHFDNIQASGDRWFREDEGAVEDTFSRTLTDTWGVPEVRGHPENDEYLGLIPSASVLSVNGSSGEITIASGDTSPHLQMLQHPFAESVRFTGECALPSVPSGTVTFHIGLLSKHLFYLGVQVDIEVDGNEVVNVALAEATDDVLFNVVNSVDPAIGLGPYSWRLEWDGSNARVKVWATGDGEPSGWLLDEPLTAPEGAGSITIGASHDGSEETVVRFDSLRAESLNRQEADTNTVVEGEALAAALSESDTDTEGESESLLATDQLIEHEADTETEAETVQFIVISLSDSDSDGTSESSSGIGREDAEIETIQESLVRPDLTDDDQDTVTEEAVPFVENFTVVFNGNSNRPGFIINLGGLFDFTRVSVFWRDPSGELPDQFVRGLQDVEVFTDAVTVTDYEAPLNREVHYYIRLETDYAGFFDFGPVLPTPQPYIPVQSQAYGGGITYLKPIDVPERSRPIMVEEFSTVDEPANVLASHRVLGRKNRVIITDVMGGATGTFSAHAALREGQSIERIKSLLRPGSTILIQNHNPTVSTFRDMYIKVTGAVSYTRQTRMRPHGRRQNPQSPHVIVTFSVPFEQVDRPDATGVALVGVVWQDIKDAFGYPGTWRQVRNSYPTWAEVLKWDPVSVAGG